MQDKNLLSEKLNNFHELHKIQGAWQAAQFFNAHALIDNRYIKNKW